MDEPVADGPADATQAEVRRRARALAGSPLADEETTSLHAATAADRDSEDASALRSALDALAAIPRAPVDGDRTDEIMARLDATERALEATLQLVTRPAHRHVGLEGQVEDLRARLRRAGRSGVWTEEGDLLLQRLEVLESVERSRRFEPWYAPGRFEEAFRGPADDLRRRYADLADLVAEHGGPVLDVGCGRGDLLDMLRSREVECRGVDTDPDVIAAAVADGLDATVGDGLETLRDAASASLGAVTAIQVLEHLTPQDVTEFVALTADKVRPGGIVVAETVNPQSLYVYSHAMWLDPTHTQPIHPAYLDFVFREAGFARTTVQMRSLPPEAEHLPTLERDGQPVDHDVVDHLNAVIERLNGLLFGPQDYAILATR